MIQARLKWYQKHAACHVVYIEDFYMQLYKIFYMCVHVGFDIYIYIYIYVCVYIYIYIHIYIYM